MKTSAQKNESRALATESVYMSASSCAILAAVTLVAGLGHLLIEWTTIGAIVDAFFVSMLVGATVVLLLGLRAITLFMRARLPAYYAFVVSIAAEHPLDRAFHAGPPDATHTRWMTIAGVAYGALVGSAPFVLDVPTPTTVKSSLAFFLFCVNFPTGIGFYALLLFFKEAVLVGRSIPVDLWRIENAATAYVLGTTRRSSLFASIYASIALTSVLFSLLPVSRLVAVYAIFAAFLTVASLVVPTFPIARRLRASRESALADVDQQLQAAFQEALEQLRAGNMNPDLTRFEKLSQLRERIASVSVWPFKLRAVAAGVSVLAVSSVPVLLQIFLERYLE